MLESKFIFWAENSFFWLPLQLEGRAVYFQNCMAQLQVIFTLREESSWECCSPLSTEEAEVRAGRCWMHILGQKFWELVLRHT